MCSASSLRMEAAERTWRFGTGTSGLHMNPTLAPSHAPVQVPSGLAPSTRGTFVPAERCIYSSTEHSLGASLGAALLGNT